MFKSLNNKRFLSLAVMSAALCSMTFAATSVGAQQENNGEPRLYVIGNNGDEIVAEEGPGRVEPYITEELVDLVAPVALYPDELLAIVLPAAAYPLQVVQAARFLEELEKDDSLQPDEDWDESIVALLNYPEVIELMNSDLEWTWQLGEAVLNQESEVIEAVETFRDRAMLAGNLKTDERQIVNNEAGTIEITPADPEVIYVPYYEPERVVVYQPYPVYHYYPRPYPVYYYPYPVDYYFSTGFFWGITTAFTIGWHSHHLNVHLWDYYSHPYYGHTYFRSNYYYHRPPHHYPRHRYAPGRQYVGDHWRPGSRHGARPVYRGRTNEHHVNNKVITTSSGSRFRQADTFRPRPGFQGNVTSATNNLSGDAVTRTRGRRSTLTGDTRSITRHDKTREYNATPKTNFASQNRQSTSKARRNRLDWEQDKRDIRREPVAQIKPSRNRVNQSAKAPGRINEPAAPSNQYRQVKRSDYNKPVPISRPSPAPGIRLPGRVSNSLTYAGSREARPAPMPRQAQQSVNRSQASRPTPAASKPSPQHRSDRGRSNSHGNRAQSHRADRVGRQ